jgi:hypothetical protein
MNPQDGDTSRAEGKPTLVVVHKALSHLLRIQILLALEVDGRLSPKRFITRASTDSEKLSLNVTAYHFRVLADLDVIECVEEVPRRGATEHWYAINPVSPAPDVLHMSAFLQDIVTQAVGIPEETGEGSHSTVVPVEVDEKGREELEGVLNGLKASLAEVARRCRSRLDPSRRNATTSKIGCATGAASDGVRHTPGL